MTNVSGPNTSFGEDEESDRFIVLIQEDGLAGIYDTEESSHDYEDLNPLLARDACWLLNAGIGRDGWNTLEKYLPEYPVVEAVGANDA